MNYFIYFFLMIIVMEIVSSLFYINPLLGLLVLIGIFWYSNNRRKTIYSQYYQKVNQQGYSNTNQNYSSYDNTNSTTVNKDNVFEAEYTEEDVHVH